MYRFLSTKHYGHDLGLSAVYRQPHADTHCRFLHGYSLAFQFTFACSELDKRNWVVDFGSLKPLLQWLRDTFDHKLIIDISDPQRKILTDLEQQGLAQITVCNRGVGVERFAEYAFAKADEIVKEATGGRCWCICAECFEHGANSAIYQA